MQFFSGVNYILYPIQALNLGKLSRFGIRTAERVTDTTRIRIRFYITAPKLTVVAVQFKIGFYKVLNLEKKLFQTDGKVPDLTGSASIRSFLHNCHIFS